MQNQSYTRRDRRVGQNRTFALQRYGYEERRAVSNARITRLRIMAAREKQGLQVSPARLERPLHGAPM